jgi:cytochrome bd-type quinol oxidase subunit 2
MILLETFPGTDGMMGLFFIVAFFLLFPTLMLVIHNGKKLDSQSRTASSVIVFIAAVIALLFLLFLLFWLFLFSF